MLNLCILFQSSIKSDSYSLILKASNGDQNAKQTFQMFVQCLGKFLLPYIQRFHTNLIIIGGFIAIHAWYLIENELNMLSCCNRLI